MFDFLVLWLCFRCKEEFCCYDEYGKILEYMAQVGGGCSIHGNIQDQVGWGSEQPALIEVSAEGLEYKLCYCLFSL